MFNAQHGDVALGVNREYAFYRINIAVVRMNFSAIRVFDYVAICDDCDRRR